MSRFPMWWDSTLTVFNRYTDKQTKVVKWYRTVLTDCFWKNTGSQVQIGDTILDSEHTICRIPKQDNFLEGGEWTRLPNDVMGSYFTLQLGDIIVKGLVDEDINEYQSGHRSTDLIAKYKPFGGCIEIKNVSVDTMTGMISPHYYVRGL